MISDVTEPHLLLTESSEHCNAMAKGMQREFTVNGLIYLMNKLVRS